MKKQELMPKISQYNQQIEDLKKQLEELEQQKNDCFENTHNEFENKLSKHISDVYLLCEDYTDESNKINDILNNCKEELLKLVNTQLETIKEQTFIQTKNFDKTTNNSFDTNNIEKDNHIVENEENTTTVEVVEEQDNIEDNIEDKNDNQNVGLNVGNKTFTIYQDGKTIDYNEEEFRQYASQYKTLTVVYEDFKTMSFDLSKNLDNLIKIHQDVNIYSFNNDDKSNKIVNHSKVNLKAMIIENTTDTNTYTDLDPNEDFLESDINYKDILQENNNEDYSNGEDSIIEDDIQDAEIIEYNENTNTKQVEETSQVEVLSEAEQIIEQYDRNRQVYKDDELTFNEMVNGYYKLFTKDENLLRDLDIVKSKVSKDIKEDLARYFSTYSDLSDDINVIDIAKNTSFSNDEISILDSQYVNNLQEFIQLPLIYKLIFMQVILDKYKLIVKQIGQNNFILCKTENGELVPDIANIFIRFADLPTKEHNIYNKDYIKYNQTIKDILKELGNDNEIEDFVKVQTLKYDKRLVGKTNIIEQTLAAQYAIIKSVE